MELQLLFRGGNKYFYGSTDSDFMNAKYLYISIFSALIFCYCMYPNNMQERERDAGTA